MELHSNLESRHAPGRYPRACALPVLQLDPATVVHPGHTLPTTIGDEWETNPFIRIWRGLDPEGSDPCDVRGESATLVLWAPDYDGTNKAWVRFGDGRDAIVGGSQVTR